MVEKYDPSFRGLQANSQQALELVNSIGIKGVKLVDLAPDDLEFIERDQAELAVIRQSEAASQANLAKSDFPLDATLETYSQETFDLYRGRGVRNIRLIQPPDEESLR